MAKVASFIQKLHELLDQHSTDDLHWLGDDAFEINGNDAAARNALSPKFEFRSLGSFNRQLSYYNFKRLSDKRRSVERQAPSRPGFIVFAHPSGTFIRGDPSRLHLIVRKARRKSDKSASTRRTSNASALSTTPSDPEQPQRIAPPMPSMPHQWIGSSREDMGGQMVLPPLSARFGGPDVNGHRQLPHYPQLPLPPHLNHDDRAMLDPHAHHNAEYQMYQPSNYGWRNRAAELGYRMQLPSIPSHPGANGASAAAAAAPSGLTAAFGFNGDPSPSDSSYSTSASGSPSWRAAEIVPPATHHHHQAHVQPAHQQHNGHRLSPHSMAPAYDNNHNSSEQIPYSHAPPYNHTSVSYSSLPPITKVAPLHAEHSSFPNSHLFYRPAGQTITVADQHNRHQE